MTRWLVASAVLFIWAICSSGCNLGGTKATPGCPDGGCAVCKSSADCDDHNSCSIDRCENGRCEYEDFPSGLACNDMDPCTIDDACQNGECVGQPKDCSSFDGPCIRGVCFPDSGQCTFLPRDDGTECDDGLYCTVEDQCQEGICTGQERDCDDGDVCTRDECNEATKGCDHELVPSGEREGPMGDSSCSNGVDDDCDGKTDLEDKQCITCSSDNECDDDNTCTADACVAEQCEFSDVQDGTSCNDGKYCTVGDECQGGLCTGQARDCSHLSDACNEGVCVEIDDTCVAQPRANGTSCEDNLYCSVSERCQDGQCVTQQRDCADDDPCTDDGCNEDTDSCDNTPVDPIPGAEGPEGNPTCQNQLDDDCDGRTDSADPDCGDCPEGQDCDDGFDCTGPDTCNESSICVGSRNDAYCDSFRPGDACVPECSMDSSGCVTIPDIMSVSCDPVQVDSHTTCTIDLSGVAGQQKCLSCEAEIGQTALDVTNFTTDGQTCSLEGWELISGDFCSETGITYCVPDDNSGQCCSDLSTICSIENGEGILEADRLNNCMGVYLREWRLRRTFDLTGYRDIEVCFEAMEYAATDNEWLLVYASDLSHPWPGDRIYCLQDGPGIDDNDNWFQVCRELPSWAEDNNAVAITIVVHSHESDDILNIRRVSVRAMSMECSRDVRIVMAEDFQGCSNQLPNPFNEWEVEGDAYCPGYSGCYQNIPGYPGVSIEAKNNALFNPPTISKYVDASSLDDRVTLCFWYGDNCADGGESIEALYDVGAGWIQAFCDERNMGIDGQCRNMCLNLSELDPAVNNHPNLGIRFRLSSNNMDRVVDLADISLRGHVFCSAAGKINLSSPSDQQDGTYEFDATNLTGSDLTARIRCEWGPTDHSLYATTEIRFPP